MTNFEDLPERLIIYDGHCVICNGSVRIISSNDKTESIRFTHSETELAKELSKQFPSDVNPETSVVFVDGGEIFGLSDAVIQIAKYLRFPYSLLRFARILPKQIRDKIYRLIASNRYRIFRRREQCILPGPQLKSKIIS